MADKRINYKIAAEGDQAKKEFKEFADAVADSSKKAENAVEELSDAQKKAAKEAVKANKEAEKAAKEFAKAQKDAADEAEQAWDNIALYAAGAATAITGSAVAIGTAVISVGAEYQTLEKRLRSTGETSADVARKMEQLRDLTRQSPFLLKDLTEQWIRLETFGLDPARGNMQALIDTGARLGGNVQKLERIVLALGQAWGKEKLQGEEALQLIEAGVDVWGILGDELGKTTAELRDMSEAGELGRDAIQLLIDGMGRVNAGQAAAQMSDWNGQLSNFLGLIDEILKEMADSGGVMQAAQTALGTIAAEFENLRREGAHLDLAENLARGIGTLGRMLPDIIRGLSTIANTVADMLPLIERAGVAIGIMWSVAKLQAYRAALIKFLATQAAATGATVTATSATIGLSTAVKGFVAFLGGPYTLALTGAVTLIYSVVRAQKEQEAQQQRMLELDRQSAENTKRMIEERKQLRDSLYEWEEALQRVGTAQELLEDPQYLRTSLEEVERLNDRRAKGIELSRAEQRRLKELMPAYKEYHKIISTVVKIEDDSIDAIKKRVDARRKQVNEDLKWLKAAADVRDAAEEINEHMEDSITIESRRNTEREETIRLEQENADRIEQTIKTVEQADQKFGEWADEIEALTRKSPIFGAFLSAFAGGLSEIADEADNAGEAIEGMETPDIDQLSAQRIAEAISDISRGIGAEVETTLGDAIFAGLTGNEEDILDAFSNLADGMASMLSDALSASLMQGDFGADSPIGQALGGMAGAGAEGVIGGLGVMMAGRQSGNVAQTVLGGFMSGMAAGGIVGGVIGAALAYFSASGQKVPETKAFIGPTGGTITAREQGFTPELEQAWIQARLGEYRTEQMEWINAIRAFRDITLFSLLPATVAPGGERLTAGALPRFGIDPETGMEMDFGDWTADQLATFFRETWLPEAFQAWAEGPIAEGLINLGVGTDQLADIFEDLSLLGDDIRMESLVAVINAARTFSEMMTDLDWKTIQADVTANSMDLFRQAFSPIGDEIQLITAGWETMSLTQRALEWENIEDLILRARQAEIQMLQQIYDLQEQITMSIEQQIEALQLGGMTQGQQASFLEQRIAGLMSDLAAATSPEEVARLVGLIQQYIGQLTSALGDALYTGGTLADHPAVRAAQESFESLFASLDWDTMTSDLQLSAMDMWRASLDPLQQQLVDIQTGWDDLDLVSRAAQWGSIEDQILAARQAEIQMLQQIQQIQDGITRSINEQIQALELGGMTEGEQRQFLQQRIQDLQRDLLNATDSAQVQQIVSDIQGYVRQLQGLYGEQLYEMDPEGLGVPVTGITPAEYLQRILEETLGLAAAANRGFTIEIQDANQDLIDSALAAATNLGLFNEALLASPILAGMPEGMTPAEYLEGLLGETLAIASSVNQGFIDEIELANTQLINNLLGAANALGIFSSALLATFGLIDVDPTTYDPDEIPPIGGTTGPTGPGGPGSIVIDQLASAGAEAQIFAGSLTSANTELETFADLLAGVTGPAGGKSGGMNTQELLAAILDQLKTRGAHVVSLQLTTNTDGIVDIVDARVDEIYDPGFAQG